MGMSRAGLVGLFVVLGRHGGFPLSDRPRPSRPSWRRKAAGGPGLHRERSEAAEAQRRMAGAGYFASRCKAPRGATENSRLTPLRGRTACRRVALSRRPGRGPLRQTRTQGPTAQRQAGDQRSCPLFRSNPQLNESRHVLGGELDAHGCSKRIDAENSADPR